MYEVVEKILSNPEHPKYPALEESGKVILKNGIQIPIESDVFACDTLGKTEFLVFIKGKDPVAYIQVSEIAAIVWTESNPQ